MHDIRFIRENPDQFDAALARRGLPASAAALLDMDSRRRALQTDLQEKQARRNDASREIGQIKSQGGDASAVMAEVAELKQSIPALETEEAALAAQITEQLISLPNILDAAVPDGEDEDQNELVREVGDKPGFSFTPRDHVDIGEGLAQMDFGVAAKLSGARFVVLKGQLARLERAWPPLCWMSIHQNMATQKCCRPHWCAPDYDRNRPVTKICRRPVSDHR